MDKILERLEMVETCQQTMEKRIEVMVDAKIEEALTESNEKEKKEAQHCNSEHEREQLRVKPGRSQEERFGRRQRIA